MNLLSDTTQTAERASEMAADLAARATGFATDVAGRASERAAELADRAGPFLHDKASDLSAKIGDEWDERSGHRKQRRTRRWRNALLVAAGLGAALVAARRLSSRPVVPTTTRHPAQPEPLRETEVWAGSAPRH